MITAQLLPTFGTGLVHLITAEDVNRYLASVADELSHKTRRNVLVLLHKVLDDAKASGYTATNPLRDTNAVQRPRAIRSEDHREIVVLTLDEVNAVLDAVEPHYRTLILTLVSSGMRLGEALGFQWGDVDPVGRVLRVERTVWKGRTYVPKSKGSRRAIDVGDQLLGALAAMKRDLPDSRRGPHDRVFLTPTGGAIDPDNFRHRVWDPALDRAKVRRVVLHSLRHTFASQLIALGEDVKYVQTQLGHASATLTLDSYGHLFPRESRRRTADRFERLLADSSVRTESAQRAQPGQTEPDETRDRVALTSRRS